MAQVQREVLGTIDICKNELRGHLGAQFDDYWRQLKDFFVFKLSKKDLDAMVTNLCGAKLHLHNSLVRAIMRDAVAKGVHHPKNVAAAAATTASAFKRIKVLPQAAAAAAAAAANFHSKNASTASGPAAATPLNKPKRKRPPSSNTAAGPVSASSTPANSERPSKPDKVRPPRDRSVKDGGEKDSSKISSKISSSAASASRKKEAAAAAAAAAASAAAAADGSKKKQQRPQSSGSAANQSKKSKDDPELERMTSAVKKAEDEAEQSLRLQETFLREFSLVDGCELNDLSAPLPHQLQIRRMMKRQVLECGIQDISKDAAKFVSDALDIYLQKLIQRMISTRGILRERKSSIVNADLGFERDRIPHLTAFASKNPQSSAQLQWAMWNADVVLPSDMIMVFRQNPKMLGRFALLHLSQSDY